MPSAGFEPAITAIMWQHTCALDLMATGIDLKIKLNIGNFGIASTLQTHETQMVMMMIMMIMIIIIIIIRLRPYVNMGLQVTA
jgi:hypothetical protein